jgi:tripartite-type tricarboxylate transporter receptor subunit TctC
MNNATINPARLRRNFFGGVALTVAAMLFPPAAPAQNYPNKLIRIITAAPGSTNDWGARLIAQEMTKTMGQPVIVENRGGLAVEYTAKSPADGYTLMFYGNTVWLLPFLRDNVGYDPLRDLAPVTLAIISPIIVVVHPSLPVRSVRELIALAKAKPGQLNYAAGTIGASPHLATELFKAMTHTDIVRIPYKGTGPSVVALVAGEAHLMFSGLGSVAMHMKTGRLRAIAVATTKPSALVPDLPTVAATVPGYEALSIIGMFAPAKTPPAIVNQLQQEIARGISKPEVKELFQNAGVEVVASTADEFSAVIKSEMARLGKVIKDAGIRE